MIRLVNSAGATLALPSTISFRQVPLTIGIPTAPNAHGDGGIVVGRIRLEPRQFTLSGSIYFSDRQPIRDFLDILLQFLQHPPIEVFKWPAPDPRRLFAYPLGVPQDWMDAGAELGINIPMVAPDPYWYGDEVEVAQLDAGLWDVDVDGTAPTHPVVTIRVRAAGGPLVIRHMSTGRLIDIVGNYAPGDVVRVDTATFTAALQSEGVETPIIDRLGNEFVGNGFSLLPGANALQYTGPDADVTLSWRPRWY